MATNQMKARIQHEQMRHQKYKVEEFKMRKMHQAREDVARQIAEEEEMIR